MEAEKKTLDEFKQALTDILKDMDVPEMRTELTEANLRWLQRNLHIHNAYSDNFTKAVLLIRWLLANDKTNDKTNDNGKGKI